MRILGVDPGLQITGLGVIEVRDEILHHVHHGAVRTRPKDPIALRLSAIRDGVEAAAREFEVTTGAVEAGYVGNNARSALALGQARAAAILGLAGAGLEVAEYAPRLVKQAVAGYGHGGKDQIAEMVRMQLGLEDLPTPADAADALAVAITHWAQVRLAGRL